MDTSCVVTGGARGIGRGIAERMVERGHRVVLTDVDGEAAAATAAEIGAAEGLAQDIREPGLAPRGRRGGRAPRRTHRVVQQRRHLPRRAARRHAGGGHPAPGRGQPARHDLGDARGDRGVRRARRRHRQHRVAVRARAGAGPQRVRRHQGRGRVADDVGRRRDAASRCGCTRCAPTACRPRCSTRRPPTRWPAGSSTPAAGSSASTRWPRRPSTWSAPARGRLSIPRWRGAVVRGTALAPSVAKRGIGLIAAQGKRRIKKGYALRWSGARA